MSHLWGGFEQQEELKVSSIECMERQLVMFILIIMTAILNEQATSLEVNLDDSALLSDGFICRGCLGAYCTYKEQLEKLKQKANQAISAFHTGCIDI